MRTLPPATGKVAWVGECPETGNPLLRISVLHASGAVQHEVYEVEEVAPNGKEPGYYRLWSLDRNNFYLKVYAVVPGRSCNCGDTHRPERRDGKCKHARGLRAALAALPF